MIYFQGNDAKSGAQGLTEHPKQVFGEVAEVVGQDGNQEAACLEGDVGECVAADCCGDEDTRAEGSLALVKPQSVAQSKEYGIDDDGGISPRRCSAAERTAHQTQQDASEEDLLVDARHCHLKQQGLRVKLLVDG